MSSAAQPTKREKIQAYHDSIESMVQFLKSKTGGKRPDIGIICGSGLGHLSKSLKAPLTTVRYDEIEGFPQSTVQGHSGEMVFGTLGGKYVACMRGRFHYYEGYEPAQVSLPVKVLAALGVKMLLVTNAAGGVNPNFDVTDLMMIDDQVNLIGMAGTNPLVGPNDARFGDRFTPMNGVFRPQLQEVVRGVASKIGYKGNLRHGTYAGLAGPCYETPHEIGMLRTCGADAVGMSTVFEIQQAAHAGLPVLGFSLITNRCIGPDDNFTPPTHQEVLAATKACEDDVRRLVSAVVGELKVDEFPDTKAYTYFKNVPCTPPAAPKAPATVATASIEVASRSKKTFLNNVLPALGVGLAAYFLIGRFRSDCPAKSL